MKLIHFFSALFLAASVSMADTGYLPEETTPSSSKGTVKDGKVEVKLTRRILWTGEPVYPVTVSLKGEDGSLFLTQKVTAGSTVTLSGFVRRGNFTIYSDIDKDAACWPSFGGKVVIAADGTISLKPQPIEHQLKMTLIGPDKLEVVTASRPTLKWKPLAGAESYKVTWLELQGKFRKVVNKKEDIPVTACEWTFDADVVRNRTYEWIVVAFNKEGRRIGYFASGYFLTK